MDIKQLNLFTAVFEEKNMTLAANRMCITQPTLSTCIKHLEEELGTPLFIRQARGVLPTEAGRALYPKARKLLTDFEHMTNSMLSGQGHIHLTLGVQTDIPNHTIQQVIQLLYHLEPKLSLSLKHGCTGDLRLDTQDQCCEDEHFTPLFSDPYGIAVSRSIMPLNEHTLTNHYLAQAKWVSCPEHQDYQRLLPIFQQYSYSVNSYAENLYLCRNIVASGAAIAFLPQSFVMDDPSLIFYPSSHPLPVKQVGICYAHHQLENPLIQELNHTLSQNAPLQQKIFHSKTSKSDFFTQD